MHCLHGCSGVKEGEVMIKTMGEVSESFWVEVSLHPAPALQMQTSGCAGGFIGNVRLRGVWQAIYSTQTLVDMNEAEKQGE